MQLPSYVHRYLPGRHRLARHGLSLVSLVLALAALLGAGVLAVSGGASAAGAHDPIGHLDSAKGTSAGNIVLHGWGFDPDAPKTALHVDVYIDGHGMRYSTSVARPDVVRAHPSAGPNTGFSITSGVLSWGTHQVCVHIINIGTGANVRLACLGVAVVDPHNPRGTFGMAINGTTVTASGYAYDNDTTSAIHVQTRVDSGAWVDVVAGRTTPAAPVSGAHGYSVSWSLSRANHTICVTAINVGAGSANTSLGCRTASLQTLNQEVAAYAKTFVGKYRYTDGGASPSTGFDCSGLTMYVYAHYGKGIPRTAAAQSTYFHPVSAAGALPGDLVFFHDGSGYVFHVGIYEGSNMMVAAATPADGIRFQSVWSSAVTYGTLR